MVALVGDADGAGRSRPASSTGCCAGAGRPAAARDGRRRGRAAAPLPRPAARAIPDPRSSRRHDEGRRRRDRRRRARRQRCAETLRAPRLRGAGADRLRRARAALRPPAALQGGAGRRAPADDVVAFRPGRLVRGERGRAAARRRAGGARRRRRRRLDLDGGDRARLRGAADRDRRRAAARCRSSTATRTSTRCAPSPTPAACAPSCAPGARLAIVGAGFIGQEVAATARAARRRGDDRRGAASCRWRRSSASEVGRWFADLHRDEGVRRARPARCSRAPAATAGSRSCMLADGDRDRLRRGRRRRRHRRRRPAGSPAAASTSPGSAPTPSGRTGLPGRLRRRRRLAPLRPPLRRPRPHRALGRRRLAGRRRGAGDARRGPGHAAAAELLERPVRPADPVRRPRRTAPTRSSSRATPASATSRPSSPARGVPVAGLAVGRPRRSRP